MIGRIGFFRKVDKSDKADKSGVVERAANCSNCSNCPRLDALEEAVRDARMRSMAQSDIIKGLSNFVDCIFRDTETYKRNVDNLLSLVLDTYVTGKKSGHDRMEIPAGDKIYHCVKHDGRWQYHLAPKGASVAFDYELGAWELG